MLKLVPEVTTAISAVAFIVAAVYYGFREYLRWKEKQLKSVPRDKRIDVIKGLNWYLDIDYKKIPGENVYQLAIQQIESKRKVQLRIILFSFLFGVVVIMSVAAISYLDNSSRYNSRPGNQTRNTSSACDDYVRDGDRRFGRNNYSAALETYLAAINDCPDDWRIFEGAGNSSYNLQRYATALQYYDKAKNLKPSEDGFLMRNMGYAQMGTGQFDDAVNSFQLARNVLGHHTETALSITSSIGLSYMLKALDQNPEKQEVTINKAFSFFDQFLEKRPTIGYWIRYYKACGFSILSQIVLEDESKVRIYQGNAIAELRGALKGLGESKSAKKNLHLEMMTNVLRGDAKYRRCASCPMICPALKAVAQPEIDAWFQGRR